MLLGVLGRASPHRRKSHLGYFLAFAFWLIGGQAAFAAVNVNPSTLPAGTQGVLYDETLTGSGGTGPYTFAVIAGSLPTGVTLDGTSGQLTGTPSAQGVYSFTIRATDALSATGSRA
jgi:Putative Ig domain